MTNVFKDQYVADGGTKDFVFSFRIPQNRSVIVYRTKKGAQADEDKDIVPSNEYLVILDDRDSPTSTGRIRFINAPASNDIITITPDQNTKVTYKFSNSVPFNTDSLNGAFDQEAVTAGYNLENYILNSIRYNVNENDGLINYDNKVTPLPDGGFWRRVGDSIVSQDFDAFVGEISKLILDLSAAYVNATEYNTRFSGGIASNDKGKQYKGKTKLVDPVTGKVVDGPEISGFSAKASAEWSKDWAVAPEEIRDDFGNVGRSAKHYAELAQIAATTSAGTVEQLRVLDAANPTTSVPLINYKTNQPWINVLPNSLTVYVNGDILVEPGSYSKPNTPAPTGTTYTVNIKTSPTLENPTIITFTPPVPAGDEILITRGVAQGDGATMFRNFNNALPFAVKDLNTIGSKAPLWGGYDVPSGAITNNVWSGGVSVETTDGKNSAAFQMQMLSDDKKAPQVYFRSNVSPDAETIDPSKFTGWQRGLTQGDNNEVNQKVSRINFNEDNQISQDAPYTNIQSFSTEDGKFKGLLLSVDSDKGNDISFVFAQNSAQGSKAFLGINKGFSEDNANVTINGDFFSGSDGQYVVPNSSFFRGSDATSGYQRFPNGFVRQWNSVRIKGHSISNEYKWPLRYKNIRSHSVASEQTVLHLDTFIPASVKTDLEGYQVMNRNATDQTFYVTSEGYV